MGNLKVWKDSHSMLRNPQSNTWSVECGVLSIRHKFGAWFSALGVLSRFLNLSCECGISVLSQVKFRQDKHVFSPKVRRASKKFIASLFDNTFRTSYLATGQVKI